MLAMVLEESNPMPRYWCALSMVIVAAVAPNASAQPAGAKRPKLEVLQALPESQLFLLMNLVADSLGVRCDHCHVQSKPDLTRTPANVGGWVWESDDKPAKRIARDMMRMVIDLNKSSFGGRSRVTCYTCHQGARDPARTPPMPPAPYGSGNTPSPAPLPSIDRVWANYLSAVGQPGTQPGATATIISGWDDRSEGRFGKFEVTVAGSNLYRATLTNAEGTTSEGGDGTVVWIAANDRVRRSAAAADVERLRRVAMRYWPVRERPANLQVVRIDRLADRDVYVARARVDATTVRTFYFDVVTGLLRRELTTTDTLLIPLQEQVDYDDYRDVDGVQWPFRIQTSDGAPYDTTTRTITQVRRNVPVDAAQFRPPGPD
jgi:hypothetical protein